MFKGKFARPAYLVRAGIRALFLTIRRIAIREIAIRKIAISLVAIILSGLLGCKPNTLPEPIHRIETPAATAGQPGDTEGRAEQKPVSTADFPPAITPSKKYPALYRISTNQDGYAQGQVPAYEKFEITFQVDTQAANPQLPYDPNPPPGIQPGAGISVEALFTPDNWHTTYRQPAFYYQDFLDQVKDGQEWFYPSGEFSWKVRFSPHLPGIWQYKLHAQDAGGVAETVPQSFTVIPSTNKGFIRVSRKDPRYFEFEDGAYFPALGYNLNYDAVSWSNPTLDNQANFQAMSENGIQLVRIWLSQWGIYGSAWNPWNAIDPELHAQYIPYTGLASEAAFPGSDVSMRIDAAQNPCMFIGQWKARPAVKRNTQYRIRVRFTTVEISSPRQPQSPYGLVAKTGGWLWGPGAFCNDPGTGQVVSAYQPRNLPWQILEGRLATGEQDFLPNFYLVLENVDQGKAYIDHVWIEEDLGNGQYGPNILPKPWMAHHLYMEQRNSYAFDRLLELARQYGIFLRPVVHEKNEWIFNHIDDRGEFLPYDPRCWEDGSEQVRGSDPANCPSNRLFYGVGQELTKVRWLQQAWWRYLQARWGYSTQIHSWELLNEGDPGDVNHFTLAGEFGRYMRRFEPNRHLVSTSFWHSFPKEAFWTRYPQVDFADVHQYIGEDEPGFVDTALAAYETSMKIGAKQPGGAGKPVIRGEIGFVAGRSSPPSDTHQGDAQGIWLHNFIWGGINPGGVIESYWYVNEHIHRRNRDGSVAFDHRGRFKAFYKFIHEIPLNNGSYQDANTEVTNTNLRAWGQKDLTNGRAHLWIHNTAHHWKNFLDQVTISPASGSVKVTGFLPGEQYRLEWWDTHQSDAEKQVIKIDLISAEEDGSITLAVEHLVSDLAVKIIRE